ncbi:MAG: flavodoxin domain-containing protein [Arachidicoccus sp.]|nr:flavodoxin domain-containing protein [Arachidicoccus sp.]
MLTKSKEQLLQSLIQDASRQELIWMSGYLSGLLASSAESKSLPQTSSNVANVKLTIIYGTETGNAKSLSVKLAAIAKKQGIKVKLESAEQYKTNTLSKEENLLIVISTQGDGEPPIAAKKFYDFLHHESSSLNNLKYAVIALGDSSYPLFCKAGEDVDIQLEKLGARRFAQVIKCDTDFEQPAAQWFENAIQNIGQSSAASAIQPKATAPAQKHTKKIYQGIVSSIINLNDTGSSKETYHIEIDADEEIHYLPGDSIGIIPRNPAHAVEEIIQLMNAKADDIIEYKGNEITLSDLLSSKLNIAYLPERIVKKYAELTDQQIPDTKISLNDLLKIYPIPENFSIEDLIKILEPITPRLYSVSSSPSGHGNTSVHITVSKNKFKVNDSFKYGLCSKYLSDFSINQELEFYVHPNNAFRLPDENKDVIMIGPGTGIAPFRSFLFERDSNGAAGRNWLFFGEQHLSTDFLYQTEIQALLETGVLTKFNGAFSRDTEEKIYVQHRMEQNAKELISWIDNGAHIYICGAKEPMSVDVENTLKKIIATEKNFDDLQASNYIDELKEKGRLIKDVY